MNTRNNAPVNGGTLEVSGRGEVEVTPDVATIRLSVLSEGRRAQDAVASSAGLTRAVVDAILAQDIRREDVQTAGLRLGPIYRYSEDAEPVIIGYRAESSVLVASPIELIGKVFDAGVAAGAGKSSGLTFGVRDEREAHGRALQAAVEAAESDAQTISEALGVELIGPVRISAMESRPGIVGEARTQVRAAETPVFPGELTISAQVRVVYRYQ
jgi:uncharacterized protein YggE